MNKYFRITSIPKFVAFLVYITALVSMLIGDYEWGIFLVLASIYIVVADVGA